MFKKYLIFFICSFIFCINLGWANLNAMATSSDNPEISQEKNLQKKESAKSFVGYFQNKIDFLKQDRIGFWRFIFLILLVFGLGILTSFTPCVYPMIPLTIGILQARGSKSLWHNFLLSFFYVNGMAFTYGFMGFLAAKSIVVFGQWLGNPYFIFFLILILGYLAFYMFGFYEIKVPSFLTKGLSVKVGGSLLYSFLFGMVSGTVASPCLVPALVAILSLAASLGNPFLGFLLLWWFSLGMGLILVLIGTFSTTLLFLPKSGEWLMEIKKFFGFVILGMCIYFLQPFFIYYVILRFYSVLLLIASIYYLSTAKGNKIKYIVAGIFAIMGIMFLFCGMTKCFL